jgi:hypothetical protein
LVFFTIVNVAEAVVSGPAQRKHLPDRPAERNSRRHRTLRARIWNRSSPRGTRVAEVLNRKRSLSIGMIRRLHDRLGISADVLIRPSQKGKAA